MSERRGTKRPSTPELPTPAFRLTGPDRTDRHLLPTAATDRPRSAAAIRRAPASLAPDTPPAPTQEAGCCLHSCQTLPGLCRGAPGPVPTLPLAGGTRLLPTRVDDPLLCSLRQRHAEPRAPAALGRAAQQYSTPAPRMPPPHLAEMLLS
ncbi:unnamed protein product [Coccothraustes coccothraustes]